jgi:ribosomal protein S12 methylthiotransferase
VRVLVDEVSEDGALARSAAEAPQIDGVVRIEKNGARLSVGAKNITSLRAGEKNIAWLNAGEWADVEIVAADAYDLTGRLTDNSGEAAGKH